MRPRSASFSAAWSLPIPRSTASPDMTMDSTQLAALAQEVGVADLFVFRRIGGNRLAHLGGVGRGEGWAGIVEVEVNAPTVLRDALLERREVWLESSTPANVFGPYYARSAVALPLPPDVVVVLGSLSGDLALLDRAALLDLAREATAAIEHVSPAKPLADELEVLHAVRAMSEISADTVEAVMEQIAACAAEALSCEVAIVHLADREHVAVADRGWQSPADKETVHSTIRALDSHRFSCPLCVQDISQQPLPEPFGRENGVCSFYLLQLERPAGYLLLLHTDAQPRGFTLLCRELGLKLVEVAQDVLGRALLRESHELELERMREQAHRDPLTGVANRLAWAEAVARATEQTTQAVSIVIVDVDRLKLINDSQGHAVGDALLREAGRRLAESIRGDDLVARIGGDEFALLLHGADADSCQVVVRRLEVQAETIDHGGGPPLSISLGYATRSPQSKEPLSDTTARADQMLLGRKEHKRALLEV